MPPAWGTAKRPAGTAGEILIRAAAVLGAEHPKFLVPGVDLLDKLGQQSSVCLDSELTVSCARNLSGLIGTHARQGQLEPETASYRRISTFPVKS